MLAYILFSWDWFSSCRWWCTVESLQWPALSPPKNRSIDEISEEFHTTSHISWRINFTYCSWIYSSQGLYSLLIICLARFATGDPWTWLIPGNFGGEVRQRSSTFRWFIEHIFLTFYHKSSGRWIQSWIHEIAFKQAILDHLAQPAHPIGVEDFKEEGIDVDVEEFIIQCPLESWHVFGFLDITAVCTCRLGSSPTGDDEGPGRPRQWIASMIQIAFIGKFIAFWTTIIFLS